MLTALQQLSVGCPLSEGCVSALLLAATGLRNLNVRAVDANADALAEQMPKLLHLSKLHIQAPHPYPQVSQQPRVHRALSQLAALPALQQLTLEGCLGGEATTTLSHLAAMPTLTFLALADTTPHVNDMEALMRWTRALPALHELHFTVTQDDGSGNTWQAVMRGLAALRHVTRLHLRADAACAVAVQRLRLALRQLTTLQAFAILGSGGFGWDPLYDVLQGLPGLRVLSLTRVCNPQPEHMLAFAQRIAALTQLRVLELGDNNLWGASLKALAEQVGSLTKLTELQLEVEFLNSADLKAGLVHLETLREHVEKVDLTYEVRY
jgi:hypothetical protein